MDIVLAFTNPERHNCEEHFGDYRLWGKAIDRCEESDDGKLWVDNNEYCSQVNFCPFCGYEAKIKIQIV